MRPSKKQLLIEQVKKLSPSADERSLNRMTIHSITVLLSTLNGNGNEVKPMAEVEGVVSKKLTRKKRSKERVLEDEEPELKAEDYIENEIIEMDGNEEVEEMEEVEEEEVIEPPKPKPVKTVKQVKQKPVKQKRGRPAKKTLEVDIAPQKEVKTRKMSDDKQKIKEILTDFRKEITKLIQQYKRIKTKTDEHKEQLKEIYNKLYDNTAKMIEGEINNSYFPDDSIYDYADKMMTNEKVRVQKLLQ